MQVFYRLFFKKEKDALLSGMMLYYLYFPFNSCHNVIQALKGFKGIIDLNRS